MLITMTLVLMPLLVAGARPWFWSSVAALFTLGLSVLVWTDKRAVSLHGISSVAIGIIVFLLIDTIHPDRAAA